MNMKTLLILTMLIAASICQDTFAQTINHSQEEPTKVNVYYFHFTRRCATCNAVESVTKEAIAEYYGTQVSFIDLNLDKKPGKQKGKELSVSGQTLLIVSGDTQINITSDGFMNARSKPEKLKQIIKEKIDPLL